MRNAIAFIQNTCCETDCSAIDLIVEASLNSTSELRLDFSGSIPTNYIDQTTGSTIIITDVGGGGPQIFNGVMVKSTYFDPPAPYIITLAGVNGALDVVVKTTYRFIDPITQATCENIVQSTALGTLTCPDLILNAGYTDINWSFSWNGSIPTVVTIELWDALGITQLQSTAVNITGISNNGIFTSLTEGTNYKIKMVIFGVSCEFEDFTTLEYACNTPSLLAPIIDYTDPEGDQTGITIAGWITEYNTFHP
jgi:hypothetical protein